MAFTISDPEGLDVELFQRKPHTCAVFCPSKSITSAARASPSPAQWVILSKSRVVAPHDNAVAQIAVRSRCLNI